MGTGISIVANNTGKFNVKLIDANDVNSKIRKNYLNQENLQRNG